jgi:hypothetical protein
MPHPWAMGRAKTVAFRPRIMYPDSQFKPFRATLAAGHTLTGWHQPYPSSRLVDKTHRSLVMGIRGGTCTAQAHDADADHAASIVSAALDIPFVVCNRPHNADSATLLPVPGGTTYLPKKENGSRAHLFTLCSAFSPSNQCADVVTPCHLRAVPGAIVAAALYRQTGRHRTRSFA